MKNNVVRVLVLFLSCFAASLSVHAAGQKPDLERLLDRARGEGSVKVLVRLAMDFSPESFLPDQAAVQAQRRTLARLQDAVLHHLEGFPVESVWKFEYSPLLAMDVTEGALQSLSHLPMVVAIEEDEPVVPTLQQSVPLIGGIPKTPWAGTGWNVAVLDTGVDYGHSFLFARLISEACYSTDNANYDSLCPGGAAETTAAGSGLNCTGVPGCDHGTHVAGIALGTCGYGGCEGFGGVAISASLVSIQVFSKRTTPSFACPSPPCLESFSSDYIKGLERVKTLHTQAQPVKMAAVNLSLGTINVFSGACTAHEARPIIQDLTNLGIAVVAGAGNGSSASGISAPACIPEAIAVGATTKTNTVASYSNSNSLLDLWAPGDNIYSSVPGGLFDYKSGTSMAAPHVAGTFARLRHKAPTYSVATLLSILQSTGVSITDSRNGVTKSRIKVDSALNALP